MPSRMVPGGHHLRVHVPMCPAHDARAIMHAGWTGRSSAGPSLFSQWSSTPLTVIPVVEMGLAVEACGVTKWFGETTALDQVDFTVLDGSVHGLLGPNGAGKTTLLSALFGLVLPDEGTLRLFGRTRAEAGPGWLDGVGGFVETPRFYPYLTGRQNLAILAILAGLAAAMLRRPRLLILDEPTNGMDPAGIRDLRAALRRLAQDGLTVLLSSHD